VITLGAVATIDNLILNLLKLGYKKHPIVDGVLHPVENTFYVDKVPAKDAVLVYIFCKNTPKGQNIGDICCMAIIDIRGHELDLDNFDLEGYLEQICLEEIEGLIQEKFKNKGKAILLGTDWTDQPSLKGRDD
jgi:hypothetical protein